MLNRSLLFLALTFQISFTASNVNAANDLEKWNSEVGRTVRQSHSDKLAQTTYKEISSKNVTVAQNMKTVYPQIETSAQVSGSKTRVVAEAVLDVDKEKVARDWNKKLSKFGKATNAVGAALTIGGLILDAVDWVMDPENNTIKKKVNPDTVAPEHPSNQYNYQLASRTNTRGSTPQQACNNGLSTKAFGDKYTTSVSYDSSKGICIAHYNFNGTTGTNEITSLPVKQVANPTYDPSAPAPTGDTVSEEEKEKILKDLLNDPKYADLASDMIGNTYTIGSDNPNPDSDVVNDIKDAQKETLKSDNPKGDGKTRTDPKIDTGTEIKTDSTTNTESTTNVNETTTTNPDGSTTTTGTNVTNNTTITNNTTEIPPFCEYAAIVCDWIDWTKEEAEEEEPEEEEDINDKGIFDRKFDLDFSLGGQCPPNLSWSMNNKYLSKTFEIDLGWACIFFTAIGYALIFLSNCLGIWIMYETVVRKEIKW